MVELKICGFKTDAQKSLDVYYKNQLVGDFKADIIVEDKVIIEIKSVETIKSVHHKQLLTYLKLTNIKLGLLINFNTSLLKDGVKRIVNNL